MLQKRQSLLKKVFVLIILFFHFSTLVYCQDYLLLEKNGKDKWTRKEWRSANTCRFAFYMGRQIKQSIRFMNLSRMYGKKFSEIYLDSLKEKDSYVLSLIKTLKTQNQKESLRPSPNLWMAAKVHSYISGIAGSSGHQGYNLRFAIFQPFSFGNKTGENCDYGARKGLEIAMDLLIDQGVPSLGHRKNILDPDFARIGGSRFLHTKYGWNAVFDYSSPKWFDFLFFRKPDISQKGLNIEFSQISEKPMFGVGAALYCNHMKTTNMLIDINYQHGFLNNNLQAISGYLGYGSSTGFGTNFMIGTKITDYINNQQPDIYIQPTISYFFIISFFRHGYLYQTGDIDKSALYRISYGYNFNINKVRNPDVYRHNITISRFISFSSGKSKKKH